MKSFLLTIDKNFSIYKTYQLIIIKTILIKMSNCNKKIDHLCKHPSKVDRVFKQINRL